MINMLHKKDFKSKQSISSNKDIKTSEGCMDRKIQKLGLVKQTKEELYVRKGGDCGLKTDPGKICFSVLID